MEKEHSKGCIIVYSNMSAKPKFVSLEKGPF